MKKARPKVDPLARRQSISKGRRSISRKANLYQPIIEDVTSTSTSSSTKTSSSSSSRSSGSEKSISSKMFMDPFYDVNEDYEIFDYNVKKYSITDIERESDDPPSDCSSINKALTELEQELKDIPDFIDTIGLAPSISQISLNISEELPPPVSTEPADIGQFVDPLTGESLSSASSATSSSSETAAAAAAALAEEGDVDVVDVINLDLVLPDLPEEKKKIIKSDDEDFGLELLFELPQVTYAADVDFEAITHRKAAKQLRKDVAILVSQLVHRAVAQSEYVDKKSVLREIMDKVQLVELLQDKINDLEKESILNRFLHTKVYLHLKRKGTYRFISADKNVSEETKKKYRDCKNNLNSLLCRQKKIRALIGSKSTVLHRVVAEMEDRVASAVSGMEELITTTLTKKKSDSFKEFIEQCLSYLGVVRVQIRQVRCVLIRYLHEYATLRKKLNAINTVGVGIQVEDFEKLDAEITTLNKKIEEINAELKAFQRNFHESLHAIAHFNEKQIGKKMLLEERKRVLNQLNIKRQNLKNRVHDLKLERIAITRELQELGFTSGIVDKPLLLKDYDDTLEKVAQVEARNKERREQIAILTEKIAIMEAEYESDYDDDII